MKNRYFPSLYYNKVYQSGDATVEFVMLDTVELCGNTVGAHCRSIQLLPKPERLSQIFR